MAESDGTRRWLLNSKLRPLLLLPSPPLPPHISHINPNKQHNQNGAETRRRYSIKAATMRIRRRCHYVTRYNKWRLRRQIYRPSPGGFNMARHVSIDVIKSLIFPLWWHPTSPTPPPRLPHASPHLPPQRNQKKINKLAAVGHHGRIACHAGIPGGGWILPEWRCGCSVGVHRPIRRSPSLLSWKSKAPNLPWNPSAAIIKQNTFKLQSNLIPLSPQKNPISELAHDSNHLNHN